jgi:hypothetical protein
MEDVRNNQILGEHFKQAVKQLLHNFPSNRNT